ncbi:MAG TPA: glycosyl hydrolase [Solirubrobacterales bacterium]|nr:glycosyl hydrolase [Solirubrobacterales bacterium]
MRARTPLVALLALVILAFSTSAAQALPAKFWGAVPQSPLGFEQYQRVHRGGVDSIRLPINWSAVQSSEGAPFDWSASDSQIAAASRARIDVLPFLAGMPAWAERMIPVGGGVQVPARLPVKGTARAGWIAFCQAAVARYGPNGSFWSENPDIPPRPLRNWQIWNEPNFKFFVHRPNPPEYGQMVKISSNAIKAVDPGAKVILAGLFAWPKGGNAKSGNHNWFASDFLEAMYRGVPGIAKRFDAVALHPYSTRYQLLTPQIEEVRAVMRKREDARTGIWITELGWSSQPRTPGNSFAKGINGQVTQLKGAFKLLVKNQRKWRLQRLFWFSIDDHGAACNFCNGSGLFGDGFTPKKSWFAYVRFAGGTP